MPNWCYTRLTINNENKNELKEFENKINKWTSYNYTENGFGLNWLGNIVGNSGVGTVSENKDTDLSCRGSLIYMENFGDQLVIDTETAWTPKMQMWIKLLEKYLPDAELIYQAEECGMALYLTNDPALVGKYGVEIFNFEEELEDFETNDSFSEEALITILQDLLKTKETDIKELLNIFKKSKFSEYMIIYKWDFAEPEEFE